MVALDRYGRTPLHHAALVDDVDAVSALLAGGVDPDIADRGGDTALHFAAQEGAAGAAARLLDAGARVDPVNSYGNTPLFTAVGHSRGSGELIRLLRDRGADPWRQNLYGQTPVGLARLIANYQVARFFDDLGEEPL